MKNITQNDRLRTLKRMSFGGFLGVCFVTAIPLLNKEYSWTNNYVTALIYFMFLSLVFLFVLYSFYKRYCRKNETSTVNGVALDVEIKKMVWQKDVPASIFYGVVLGLLNYSPLSKISFFVTSVSFTLLCFLANFTVTFIAYKLIKNRR